MVHVAPPNPVVLRDLDGRAEHGPLGFEPGGAEVFVRELALLASLGVERVLETVHGDLAKDRRDSVVDAANHQAQAPLRVFLRFQETGERYRLAKDRRRLRRGQWSVEVKV